VTYKSFEVIVVPFPFTDRKEGKRRPALVLSDNIQFNKPSGHTVLAMITSQKNPDWPLDTAITDNRQAGLTAPSKVRMKLFTLDNRLIVKKIGTLNDKDKKAIIKALQSLLVTKLDLHSKRGR
jgi:mRNA interferase MazF